MPTVYEILAKHHEDTSAAQERAKTFELLYQKMAHLYSDERFKARNAAKYAGERQMLGLMAGALIVISLRAFDESVIAGIGLMACAAGLYGLPYLLPLEDRRPGADRHV